MMVYTFQILRFINFFIKPNKEKSKKKKSVLLNILNCIDNVEVGVLMPGIRLPYKFEVSLSDQVFIYNTTRES